MLNVDAESDDSAEDMKRRKTFNQIDSAHHKGLADESAHQLIQASESVDDQDPVATSVLIDDTPR